MIQVGDWVQLKADLRAEAAGTLVTTGAMVVLQVERGCDGTGGDGAGLLCRWLSNTGSPVEGWLSESAVEPVTVGGGDGR